MGCSCSDVADITDVTDFPDKKPTLTQRFLFPQNIFHAM